MSSPEFETLLQFFKVLANESRLKMLGMLASEERSVGELAAMLDLKEPTVSHHLALMKELGLVTVRAEGTTRIYSLDSKSLEALSRDVFSQDTLTHLVDYQVEDVWERKVLKSFMDGERIMQIPAQRKKRLAIVRWLAGQFDFDVQYPETEINERIERHHADYAAFRRYLVEYGFMRRDKGIYWRVQPQ